MSLRPKLRKSLMEDRKTDGTDSRYRLIMRGKTKYDNRNNRGRQTVWVEPVFSTGSRTSSQTFGNLAHSLGFFVSFS
jgi:hypothetical protein